MYKKIIQLDQGIISTLQKWFIPAARIAFCVVYFWFGILKVLSLSPANPLVKELMETTLPFLTFDQFIIGFGLFECFIGITFLFPLLSRLAILLMGLHMITTILPLIALPQIVWSGFLVPTLEGQYIIKNLVFLACGMGIAANIEPWQKK